MTVAVLGTTDMENLQTEREEPAGTEEAGSAGSVGTAPGHAEQQMRSGIMAPTMPASRVQIICRCNSLPDLVGSEQAPSGLADTLGRLADTMTKR